MWMAIETKDYTIPAQLLGALGTLWAGNATSISPFKYGKGGAVGTKERAALLAAGICDTQGQIVPAIRPAIDILGNAEAFTRMYLTGGPDTYEYLVYFDAGGNTVSMVNAGGEFQISYPSREGLFVEMAAQTIGFSLFRIAPLETSLSHDEALVFSGLVDIQRRAFLRSLADGGGARVIDASPGEIGSALARKEGDYQWLGVVMMSLLERESPPAPDHIAAALVSLAGKGLATASGAVWRLSDTGSLLARRMLVFDASLVLTAGSGGRSGKVNVAGFTCLQAGVHDLLFIDAGASTVELQSISSAGVIEYVRKFLTDMSVHRNLGSTAVAGPSPDVPGSGTEKKFCPGCGSPVKDGLKFCSNCGYKIE
jgi:hypothetical protein